MWVASTDDISPSETRWDSYIKILLYYDIFYPSFSISYVVVLSNLSKIGATRVIARTKVLFVLGAAADRILDFNILVLFSLCLALIEV